MNVSEYLKLETVKLKVRKENTSAFMLYKKLGFEVENEENVWISMEIKAYKRQPTCIS